MLGDFNATVGRENIFKPTIGNESLHQGNDDNGVRIVVFATSNNLVVKSTVFPLRNIHKHTWISLMGRLTTISTIHWQIGDDIRVYSTCYLSGELTVILITIWWLKKLGKYWQKLNKHHNSLM
jgi:hypothetical protein